MIKFKEHKGEPMSKQIAYSWQMPYVDGLGNSCEKFPGYKNMIFCERQCGTPPNFFFIHSTMHTNGSADQLVEIDRILICRGCGHSQEYNLGKRV